MVRFGFAVLTSACLLSSAGAAEGLVALFDAQSHDFGNVPVGPTVNHGFTLKNTTNQTLQIGGLRVSCGCTTPTVSATVIPPGKTAVLNAAMDTRRFVGAKTVTIFVTFTQPHFEETRLSVSAFSRNDIAMNPDRLDFGQVRKGAPATASTTISFTSGMRVTEANSESGYVQLSFKEPKQTQWGLSYELTAKLRSDIPAGRWITDVWVKTDNNTRLRIPVTVEVEAALSLAGPEDGVLVAGWFTYLEDNSSVWYFLNDQIAPRAAVWDVPITRTAWDGTMATGNRVGRAQLTLVAPNELRFAWQLNGELGFETLQPIASAPACPRVNGVATSYSGSWFRPERPGYGVVFYVTSQAELSTLFAYDASGVPRWAIGSSTQALADTPFQMAALSGFCPSCARTEPLPSPAGTLTRRFLSVNQASYQSAVSWPSPLTGAWPDSGTLQIASEELRCPP